HRPCGHQRADFFNDRDDAERLRHGPSNLSLSERLPAVSAIGQGLPLRAALERQLDGPGRSFARDSDFSPKFFAGFDSRKVGVLRQEEQNSLVQEQNARRRLVELIALLFTPRTYPDPGVGAGL